ncbi:MAG: tetratricopeptide repeat protein [Armatimonadetes bacterium]|nr:tetratricopeptide repeat protein [Armatimonadota bacterium]
MPLALNLHNQILSRHFSVAGSVFKTVGDAFCVRYDDVREAVIAVRLCFAEIAQTEWPTPTPIRVRWAIHAGPALAVDGDFFGPTLNKVARILGLCHPDQILMSDATAALDPSSETRFVGHYALRGIRERVGVCQLLGPGLPEKFPPLTGITSAKTNLQRFVTEIIGKEPELDVLSHKLGTHRWVSLCGPAGVGKTRLATEIGWRELDRYPDGVFFVDLSKLGDDYDPQAEVLRALEMPAEISEATKLMTHHRKLLILDNCEHMIAPVLTLVRQLLSHTHNLTILTTSRQALGGQGEAVIRAVPLVSQEDALNLLLARGKDARSDFSIAPPEKETATKLVNLLDRVPLAIEFAAARLGAFDLQTLYESLVEDLSGLNSPDITATDRQASLTGMIHWSYRLLPGEAQGVLSRLSVMRGGFNLVAARYVARGELEESSIPRWIEVLVRSSLIQFDPDTRRYRLLESVRDFAQSKLESWGEAEEVQDRFLRWLVNLAEESRPQLDGHDHAKWIGILEQEHANVRAALTANSDPELRLRVAVALHQFWLTAGHVHEGRAWVEGTLRRSSEEATLLHCQAFSMAGVLAWSAGDLEEAERYLAKALTQAETAGELLEVAKAASNLGLIEVGRSNFVLARHYFERARAIYESKKDAPRLYRIISNLGTIHLLSGKPQAAIGSFETVEMYEAENGNPIVALIARSNKHEAQLQSNPDVDIEVELHETLRERIALADKLGVTYSIALILVAARPPFDHRHIQMLGYLAESARKGHRDSNFVEDRLDSVRRILISTFHPELYEEHLQIGIRMCQDTSLEGVTLWIRR